MKSDAIGKGKADYPRTFLKAARCRCLREEEKGSLGHHEHWVMLAVFLLLSRDSLSPFSFSSEVRGKIKRKEKVLARIGTD